MDFSGRVCPADVRFGWLICTLGDTVGQFRTEQGRRVCGLSAMSHLKKKCRHLKRKFVNCLAYQQLVLYI